MSDAHVLAVDLGGTKLAAALVQRSHIVERREIATERSGGPDAWIADLGRLVADWRGCTAAGVAVTGLVHHGVWRALNPETLPIPDDFPLVATLERRLGLPVTARNDAQAAAWGEYRFGSNRVRDLVFATVSTGIGGGIIAAGRLLEGRGGMAGHIGITPVDTPQGERKLEDVASGSALARLARSQGGPAATTAAASRAEPWALVLLDAVVAPFAQALRRLQFELDPEVFVIGGGLGLAPGYIDRLRHHLADTPATLRPTLVAASLGRDAGLIGIADLATLERTDR